MKTKPKAQSTASDEDSQAEALEDELLQSPPKGNLDKMRVLRSRLKRLSRKLPDRVIGSPGGTQQTPAGGTEGPEQVGPSLPCQDVCSHACVRHNKALLTLGWMAIQWSTICYGITIRMSHTIMYFCPRSCTHGAVLHTCAIRTYHCSTLRLREDVTARVSATV